MKMGSVRFVEGRMKIERKRWSRCSWCKEFRNVPLRGFTLHGCTSTTVRYCPVCGKPLTEDAWAEFERKVGEICSV